VCLMCRIATRLLRHVLYAMLVTSCREMCSAPSNRVARPASLAGLVPLARCLAIALVPDVTIHCLSPLS
jgi:hypothetical protein